MVKGARPACIIDSLRYNDGLLNDFLEIVPLYYEDLTFIKLTTVEYLVCLTSNKEQVLKDYKSNPGKALGYCYLFTRQDYEYTTERWINDPKYAIYYYVISNISGNKVELFITVVPVNKFDDKVKQCIENHIVSFNHVLSNLDYKATYEIKN